MRTHPSQPLLPTDLYFSGLTDTRAMLGNLFYGRKGLTKFVTDCLIQKFGINQEPIPGINLIICKRV